MTLEGYLGILQDLGSSKNVTDLADPKYSWSLSPIFEDVCLIKIPKAFAASCSAVQLV